MLVFSTMKPTIKATGDTCSRGIYMVSFLYFSWINGKDGGPKELINVANPFFFDSIHVTNLRVMLCVVLGIWCLTLHGASLTALLDAVKEVLEEV